MHDREISDLLEIIQLLGLAVGEQAPRRGFTRHHGMGRVGQEKGIDLALFQQPAEVRAVADEIELNALLDVELDLFVGGEQPVDVFPGHIVMELHIAFGEERQRRLERR